MPARHIHPPLPGHRRKRRDQPADAPPLLARRALAVPSLARWLRLWWLHRQLDQATREFVCARNRLATCSDPVRSIQLWACCETRRQRCAALTAQIAGVLNRG